MLRDNLARIDGSRPHACGLTCTNVVMQELPRGADDVPRSSREDEPGFHAAMQQIYLDYNATTPIAGSVLEAMRPFLERYYGNPSSGHAIGRACAEAVQDARERIAELLGCFSDEVVFTSGGTESNNLAIVGSLLQLRKSVHMILSAIEHPAVVAPAKWLEKFGVQLTVVGCDSWGMVDPDEVRRAMRPNTRLVSIMHANNEVGTIQPISEIAAVCQAQGALLHVDAAQAMGKIRVDVVELGADLLSIAGHKFYGPKGVGALYVREGVHLEPVIHGAGHERGLRPGTENVASIVGLGQAARLAAGHLSRDNDTMDRLRDRLHQQLLHDGPEPLRLQGHPSERLPNTLNLAFDGVSAATLLQHTPEICASTGSACHTGQAGMSPTLRAMGVSADVAKSAVRLSLGWSTTEEQVDRAASLLLQAWESLVRV